MTTTGTILPRPVRAVRAVARSPVAGRIADAQAAVYAPVFAAARRSPLHSDVLGHSLHPPLTDLTIGCWVGVALLDVAGGPECRRAALLLAGAGVVLSAPTAVAGAADWSELTGEDRRIGAVHALGTDAATVALAASVVARLRGHHRAGAGLALAGTAVMTAAGLLGAHLALARGVARRGRRRAA